MPVTVECNPDILVVTVNISAGQRLRHTIDDEDARDIEFALVNNAGKKLLETLKPPRIIIWPNNEFPAPAQIDRHTLGLQFTGQATIKWKVELLSGDTVLQTLKECEYTNDGGIHAHFNRLRIEVE